MQKLMLVVVVLFTGMACQKQQSDLGDYEEIQEVFTEAEISDLTKIIAFFSDAVCASEGMEMENVNGCYQRYLERLAAAETSGNIQTQISHQEQTQLMESIDDQTFAQIWSYGEVRNSSADSPKRIYINTSGKYVAFLNKFGEQNARVKTYHEKLIQIGDVSPSMVADLLKNYADYDLQDARTKLLFAIHYLTLNDQYKAG